MAIDLGIGIPRIEINTSRLPSDQALARIAGGSTLLFVVTLLGLGLNYLYSIVLARVMGPEQFGFYALGLGCFNLLSVIALAGLDTAVLRFVPTMRIQSDVAGVGRIIRAALILAAGLGVISAGGLLLSSDTLATRFFHNDETSSVLKLFALSIPLLVVSTVALATLQAFREVRWRISIKYLCEPVVKVAVTLALVWWGWGLTSALVALPVALGLTTIFAILPLHRLLSNGNDARPSGIAYREVVLYSLPLLGGLVFNGLATRSDVLLLGYWSSLEDVGIYSAAFQTSAIMALVLGTLESIATPFLSESISKNDPSQIRSLTGTVLRWTVTGTLPLCIVMAVFAKDIMSLFGNQFESGAVCLIILAVGQFIYSVTGCSHGMLLWAGHSKLVMWNSIAVSAVQIGLYLILIPSYGIVGATLATSASLVLTVILRTVQVHHILDIWPFDSTIYKPLVAGAAALSLVLTIKYVPLLSHVAVLLGFFILSYVGFLFALGLHEGDRAVLLQLKRRFNQFT